VKAVRNQPFVREHDDEALPGLPSALPAGERLLWRGAPDWRILAGRSFHLRKLAAYFGVLAAWRFASVLGDDGSLMDAAASALMTLPLAALALGLIALLCWLAATYTVYTLTDRRLVMRVGIVLTVTFNLPLRRIETARLHPLPGGGGDIALLLNAEDRIGYIHLWPHARPWHFNRPEPMLRALPDAAAVAGLLAEALQKSLAKPVRIPAEHVGVERDDDGRGARPPMASAA